jgi:mannan endo-1,6-alpha-mannosidase
MVCSMQWTEGHYDGRPRGVGEQLSVFNVLNANLIQQVAPPVTANEGGTSPGDPNAGTKNPDFQDKILATRHVTTGDKALAGVLTGATGLVVVWSAWLMLK